MELNMERTFTLEYWIDDGWYVGRLKEVPGVFSQGADLPELEKNIRNAYRMIADEQDDPGLPAGLQRKDLSVQV